MSHSLFATNGAKNTHLPACQLAPAYEANALGKIRTIFVDARVEQAPAAEAAAPSAPRARPAVSADVGNWMYLTAAMICGP